MSTKNSRNQSPAKLSPQKVEKFLEALMNNGGNITNAADAAGSKKIYFYNLAKTDEEFKRRFDEARELGLQSLEDEARRRAFEGTQEPVYYQGREVGSVTRYSDSLMALLLKGGMPEKYADRTKTELSGANGGPLQQSLEVSSAVQNYLSELKSSEESES